MTAPASFATLIGTLQLARAVAESWQGGRGHASFRVAG